MAGETVHTRVIICVRRLRPWEVCAIVKSEGVCISQTGLGIVGAGTSGVRDDGRMSSSSSMMRSYAVGLTFGGIGEPFSW